MKKNIDILLINPPSSQGKKGRGDYFTPPMGLAYLASYVQKYNIVVDIIDCNPEGIYIDYFNPKKNQEDTLLNILLEYSTPLIIGIGPITTPFLSNSLSIARYIKNIYKDSFLIIGGPHPSIMPPQMAFKMLNMFSYIDGVCINEGEITLLKLFYKLKQNALDNALKGLVYRYEDTYIYNERKLLNSDELNELPFPARLLLDKYSENYKLALRRSFFKIISDKERIKEYGNNPKFTVLFSSRGCPYNCSFCCSISKRRVRSADNVVQEIKHCIDKYNIHCFVFYDDLFTTAANNEIQRIQNICNELLLINKEIFWEIELRADVICKINKEILKLMNKAGCVTINIGIEKTSNNSLKWLKKDINTKQIVKAIKLIRESGNFIINGTFILGGHNERKKDIEKIIEFSKKLGIDYAAFYPLEIHPGTKLFEEAKKIGLVNDLLNDYLVETGEYPLFINKYLNKQLLYQLQCEAYQKFYFDPNYIQFLIGKLNSIDVVYKLYKHIFEHAFMKGVR